MRAQDTLGHVLRDSVSEVNGQDVSQVDLRRSTACLRNLAVHANRGVRNIALGAYVVEDWRHILVARSAVERFRGEVRQDGVVRVLRANGLILDLLVALLVIGITSGHIVYLHAS